MPEREWRDHLRAQLASLRLSPEREAEIIEELSQHLDDRYEELRAAGTTEDEARRVALDEMRETDTFARHMRSLRQVRVPPPIAPGVSRRDLLGDLAQDIRYAARTLRKQPGFTAAVVVTLALGIGANTAIFSLVNATLLQRLPVADRERLVYVSRGDGGVLPYPGYAALRDGNRVFDGFAAWGGLTASLNADGAAELVRGVIVTGNFFGVLGIRAGHGRLLTTADDRTPGAHPVAVISHDFWQSRFGGRGDILGREIRLNGQVFTIVGVTPAGFPGPQLGDPLDLYVPMMMQAVMRPPRAGYSGERNPDLLNNRTNSWLFGVGRLKPGVTAEQATADLDPIVTAYAQSIPGGRPRQRVTTRVVHVDDANADERRQMQSVALLLGGVAGAVLLIGCTNVANLLLSRAASRRRELAVRLAIGANRARLMRQLLTESVLLSLLGGAAGVALAWAIVDAFATWPPPVGAIPIAIDFAIDGRVLMFSLALSLTTGIVFGLAPALKASRPSVVPALKEAASDADDHPRRIGMKQILVVAEVTLSLLLLIAAGLFVRSLRAAQAIELGFDAPTLVSAPLNVNLLRYTSAQGREFYRRVVERVEQVPGVQSATVARVALLAGGGRVLSLHVEGREAPDTQMMNEGGGAAALDRAQVNANVVGPRYFQTVGIPLVRGRDFSEADAEGRPLVVIVNEAFVATHFAGENPIGRRVSFGGLQGPWREIIGVVRNSKYYFVREPALLMAYLPLAQNHETGVTLYARTSLSPESLVASIRREIQSLEPNLPVPNIQTMTETVGTSLYAARMGAWLLAVFGGLALLLAAVGIYGVLSFAISRRTREMGIRLALGADARDVFLLVVRDGMLLVAVGTIFGVAGALAGGRSLAGFLYGVPTSDLPTFAATTTILIAVALAACIIPARRAMRVNPIAALRYD